MGSSELVKLPRIRLARAEQATVGCRTSTERNCNQKSPVARITSGTLEERVSRQGDVLSMNANGFVGTLRVPTQHMVVVITNTGSTMMNARVEGKSLRESVTLPPSAALLLPTGQDLRLKVDCSARFLATLVSAPVAAACTDDLKRLGRNGDPSEDVATISDPILPVAAQTIWDTLNGRRASYATLIKGAVSLLLITALDAAYAKPSVPQSSLSAAQIRQIADKIDVTGTAELSIIDLAASCDMSVPTFRAAFLAAFGTTPKKYLVECRVKRARELLAETEENFAAIAIDCGFYDQSHLIRTFRRCVGLTPGAFRLAARTQGLSVS